MTEPGQGQRSLSERIVAGIQRFRAPLLALAALWLALCGWQAARIGVDNAVEVWFLEGDRALTDYRRFQQVFGNDEVVVIGVSPPGGALSAEGLALIREVEARAEAVEGVADAQSVASAVGFGGEGGALEVGPAVPEGEITAAEAAAAAEKIKRDPLLSRFVSDDGRMGLVLARMEAMGDIDARRDGILAALRAALADVQPAPSYAGIGVVYAALNDASTRGAAGFVAASAALVTALLWALYGRIGPTLLTLGAVGLASGTLLGVYGAAGRDINMVTMVLPTLVLVIGVSTCVHMLTQVAEEPADKPAIERVISGIGFVFWPCLINTLTTCVGFLALCTADMRVIRDLGLYGAVGMGAEFVAALLLCGALASFYWFNPLLREGGALQRALNRIADFAVRRRRAVLVGALFASLVSALGVTRLEVDTYSLGFLRRSHPVRQDSERIEAIYGPYTPLEFVVRAPDVQDPAVLAAVAAWQDRLAAVEGVGWTRSPADGLRRLNQVLTGGSASGYAIPADPDALEQLLFLYGSHPDSDLPHYVGEDGAAARVTVGVPMGSARQIGEITDRILAEARLPPGVTVTASGYLPLYVRMMDYIVDSQLSSFASAFLVIFALVGLLFRSLRMAILAVPSNLLPVLMTLGLMGLAGVPLDVATVTIAAIVLGLVVDDTVQFLYRYRHEMGRHASEEEAVKATIRGVGRPMAITALVLALGFSILGFAAVKSVAYFGLLVAFALASAVVCDLLVMPALLVTLGRREGERAEF